MRERCFNIGMRNALINFACGMILLFVITIIPICIRHAILDGYKIIIMFVQHLPPQTIANNLEILDAITRKRKSADHKKCQFQSRSYMMLMSALSLQMHPTSSKLLIRASLKHCFDP